MILHYWKNLQKTKQLIGFFIFQRKEKEEKKNKNIKGGEVSHFCNLFFFFKKKHPIISNNWRGKFLFVPKERWQKEKYKWEINSFFTHPWFFVFFTKERKIKCFLYFERKPTFYISKKNRVRRKTRTVKDNGDLIWFDSDGSLDCDIVPLFFVFFWTVCSCFRATVVFWKVMSS